MKFHAILCLGLIVISLIGNATSALAQRIENGFWYNSSRGGEGYAIEQQASQVFMTFYRYNASGAPEWYYALGDFSSLPVSGVFGSNGGVASFSGNLSRASGGSAIGAPFRAITGSSVLGTFTINFLSSYVARMQIRLNSGGTENIDLTRYPFDNDASSLKTSLLGQWMIGYVISSTAPTRSDHYGDYFWFDTVGAVVSTGGLGLITGRNSPQASAECYSATAPNFSFQCLIVIRNSSGGLLESFLVNNPINELRGAYSFGTSTNQYVARGIRIGLKSGPYALGSTALGNVLSMSAGLPNANADDDDLEARKRNQDALVTQQNKGKIAITQVAGLREMTDQEKVSLKDCIDRLLAAGSAAPESPR
jgi:hypothetical protein